MTNTERLECIAKLASELRVHLRIIVANGFSHARALQVERWLAQLEGWAILNLDTSIEKEQANSRD